MGAFHYHQYAYIVRRKSTGYMSTKKINGKLFRLVSSHAKKSIAEVKAARIRGTGKLVRVLRGTNKQNKTVYRVFSASPGGAPSKKRGQTHISGYGRKVLKPSGRQTGKSNEKADKARKAMRPGKRRSAAGNVYHENRKNRSDLKGKRV